MKMWCQAIEVFEARFSNFGQILQTAYCRVPKLVSKDTQESVSYNHSVGLKALFATEKKLMKKN